MKTRLRTEPEILAHAAAFLAREDFNGALITILEAMTEYQHLVPGIHDVTTSMPGLDAFCQQIGKRFLNSTTGSRLQKFSPRDVYLASEIYAVGGHTGLIGDYVGNSSGREAFLLLSNTFDRPATEENAIARTGIPMENVEICPHQSLQEKTCWMIQRLETLQPDRLFILNHPQDPVPIAAAQPELSPSTYFVHHADHSPALGASIAFTGHIDLTPRAYWCCQSLWGMREAIYLPLQCYEPATFGPQNHSILATASSGSQSKYNWEGPMAYPAVITKLLTHTSISHFHIGPLSKKRMKAWQECLSLAGIDPERLIFVGRVSSVWQAMHDLKIDLYLHSFPSTGARAAVEIMGSGTPLLMHSAIGETARSSAKLVYPEVEMWSTVEDLIQSVKSADAAWLAAQRGFARCYFELNHVRNLLIPIFQKEPISGLLPAQLGNEVLALFRKDVNDFRQKYLRPTWQQRGMNHLRRLWKK